VLWKSPGFYRQNRAFGYTYGVACHILVCLHKGAMESGYVRVFTAIVRPHAARRLQRSPLLSPYRLDVLVSEFDPLVLMKLLSKVNGYLCRPLITN